MLASAAAVYCALYEVTPDQASKWLGIPRARINRMRTVAGLPTKRQDLVDVWQAALLTSTLRGNEIEAFRGLGELTEIIDRTSSLVSSIIDEIQGDKSLTLSERMDHLTTLTGILVSLSQLAAPIAFLYRDSLDRGLDTRIKEHLRKPWTNRLIDNLMELVRRSEAPRPD